MPISQGDAHPSSSRLIVSCRTRTLSSAILRAPCSPPYSIVHIASHGQFSGDSNQTFLLAYNEKLSIDRLEELMGLSQYRKQPVELLTLSACQSRW